MASQEINYDKERVDVCELVQNNDNQDAIVSNHLLTTASQAHNPILNDTSPDQQAQVGEIETCSADQLMIANTSESGPVSAFLQEDI